MKKGAYFSVVVHVVGDDKAEHSFARAAQDAVKQMLESGTSQDHPQWRVEIVQIEETDAPGEWDVPPPASGAQAAAGSLGSKAGHEKPPESDEPKGGGKPGSGNKVG